LDAADLPDKVVVELLVVVDRIGEDLPATIGGVLLPENEPAGGCIALGKSSNEVTYLLSFLKEFFKSKKISKLTDIKGWKGFGQHLHLVY
jgi:hypothetical protein